MSAPDHDGRASIDPPYAGVLKAGSIERAAADRAAETNYKTAHTSLWGEPVPDLALDVSDQQDAAWSDNPLYPKPMIAAAFG